SASRAYPRSLRAASPSQHVTTRLIPRYRIPSHADQHLREQVIDRRAAGAFECDTGEHGVCMSIRPGADPHAQGNVPLCLWSRRTFHMLSKRVLSVVATGAVTASLLLAACGTSGGTSSQTVNYSGTLTIWHD